MAKNALNITTRHPRTSSFEPSWPLQYGCLFLAAVTVLFLAPFLGSAFHIDEPLFIWTARQIVNQPLNPYGFNVVWTSTTTPMFEATKNPPLASYFAALCGKCFGWSETALHSGFLLPAIGLILGTYYLARRFTRLPLIASIACLCSPAFMVSATKVMSDTLMVALWLWAAILWLEGLDRDKPLFLASSGLLIALAALAKYFAAALIPLLFVVTLAKKRRLGNWVWYLAIPFLILLGYETWSRALYGQGLIVEAASYAHASNSQDSVSWPANGVVGIAFIGGCMLPGLLATPFFWSRKEVLAGIALCGLAAFAVANGWLASTSYVPGSHLVFVGLQFSLCLAGGLSILGLAASDWRRTRDSNSLLLALWVLGTLVFTSFLNWTVNARSILPMIPAAGILMARRFESSTESNLKRRMAVLVFSLWLPGILSLAVVSSDARACGIRTRGRLCIAGQGSKLYGIPSLPGALGLSILHGIAWSSAAG